MSAKTQTMGLIACSISLACAVSFVSGCASLNEANDVNCIPDGQFTVAAITDDEPTAFADHPSLQSLDRSSWPTTTVFVAHGEPMTRPVYWQSYRFEDKKAIADGNGRYHGDYPTIDSVLYVYPGPSGGPVEYAEMIVDPFVQICNVALAPIRLFTTNRPNHLNAGARGSYVLSPTGLKPVEMTEAVSDAETVIE